MSQIEPVFFFLNHGFRTKVVLPTSSLEEITMEIPMYPMFALAFLTVACLGFVYQLSDKPEGLASVAIHHFKSFLMAAIFVGSCQYFWKLSNTYFLWSALVRWLVGSLIGNWISQKIQLYTVLITNSEEGESHQTKKAG